MNLVEMKISKAFIETIGNKQLEEEMQDVYDEFHARNIPIELFTGKRLQRRQLPIAKDTLIVAYVDSILTALKILGIEHPPTNDYPESLQSFLHRPVWENTVASFIMQISDGSKPVFAKPKDRKKHFTGRVFSHLSDVAYLGGISKKAVLLCSDVVEWLSEYRVFVIKGKIVGIQHYSGDTELDIDKTVVNTAINILENAGEATSAYAIDFGLLSSGQTALVEWNDGFSLGSYGLDRSIYTDLLITRWIELSNEL